MQTQDCTIIGGGPVGLFLARQLEEFDVRILEEHAEIGKPVQCTGLLSKNIDALHKLPQECILNTVKGAKIYSPSGKILELARKQDEAYVIDRALFDKSLAEGVEIDRGKRVEHINFNSKYIVGADGPNSTVAQLAGFPEIEEKLFGVQYEIPLRSYDTDFVELYFGNQVAPGFFAWVVPTDSRLRVGLAGNENVKEYLDRFVRKKFGQPEILGTQAGVIPLKIRQEFVKGNIALVGDSAGQVKPTTGGGIIMSFKSAKILADAIKNNDLNSYEKNWDKELGKDFWVGGLIRKLVKKMPDNEMDNAWDTLASEGMKKLLEKHGDMDHPTKLVKAGLKNLSFLKLLPYAKYLF
jgi:flavin-dependent dehydrogenase